MMVVIVCSRDLWSYTNRTRDNGKYWSEYAVYRILTSEVHMGKVVYGKTSGSGHKNKPNAKGVASKDRSEWIVEEGSHPQLKTYEEHERIIAILEERKIKPRASRKTVQVLNKLLFCGKCGGALQFLNRKNGKVHVKTCQRSDPFGNRCGNSGVDVQVIYAKLFYDLEQYEQRIKNKAPQNDHKDNSTLEIALQNKKDELQELVKGLDRIEELYIDGLMDKAKFKIRTEKQDRKIQMAREEIANLEKSLALIHNVKSDEERMNAILAFKEAWDVKGIENTELNRLARVLIDRIEYVREGESIEINIHFL